MIIAQINRNYVRTKPLKIWSRFLSYSLFEGRPLTTRGQWINPLIFTLFAVQRRLPRMRKVEKPIFIIGAGRSGTTILGIILSLHRDIGFLNEPKALWHAIHPHEDLIGSYDRGPAFYRLGEGEATQERIETAHRLYSAYLFSTCSHRVVDKYPEMIFRIPFIRRIFPDARFLFMVRNGWDTCHSIDQWSRRHSTTHSQERHDWWGVNDRKWKLMIEQIACDDPDFKYRLDKLRTIERHTDRAALEWILTTREGIRLEQELPAIIRSVRYENFVRDPVRELREILSFCELPFDEKCYSYADTALAPASVRKPFELDETLRDEFITTMSALGYS